MLDNEIILTYHWHIIRGQVRQDGKTSELDSRRQDCLPDFFFNQYKAQYLFVKDTYCPF
jgi:hypothetical protein